MAGTPSLFAGIGAQFFTNDGVPLAGGKISSFLAGTTTPVATYTDYLVIQAHPNPIILDSAGRVPSGGEIWLKEGDVTEYKFVLKDADDVLIATYDYVPGTYSATDLGNTTDPAKGDALVGFRQANASGNLPNAVARTVHDKLQEFVSVKDFGATGDGVTDDSAAIQAAVNASNAVFFPVGNYFIASTITLPNKNMTLFGEGQLSTITGAVSPLIAYNPSFSTAYVNIYKLSFLATGDNTSIQMHGIWTSAGKAGPTIENCWFINSSQTTTTAKCISLKGVWASKIINNFFRGFGGGGSPSTNIGGYGIFVELGNDFNTSVMNMMICENKFLTMGRPIFFSDRTLNTGGRIEGVFIVNNSFVAGNTAITSFKTLSLKINDNAISDYRVGIDLNGDFQFNITGNQQIDGNVAGIKLNAVSDGFTQQGVISSNGILTSTSSAGIGIELVNNVSDSRVRDITIVGNQIGKGPTGAADSIGIKYSNTFSIPAINIVGNTFMQLLTAVDNGTVDNASSSQSANTCIFVTNPLPVLGSGFAATVVRTLTGGAPTEIIDIAIPSGTFFRPPISGYCMQDALSTQSIIGFFSNSITTPETTKTNARFVVKKMDGTNLSAGAVRLNIGLMGA